MYFGTMTHFDPLKSSDGQKLEFLKTKIADTGDSRYPAISPVDILRLSKGQHRHRADADWGVLYRDTYWRQLEKGRLIGK